MIMMSTHNQNNNSNFHSVLSAYKFLLLAVVTTITVSSVYVKEVSGYDISFRTNDPRQHPINISISNQQQQQKRRRRRRRRKRELQDQNVFDHNETDDNMADTIDTEVSTRQSNSRCILNEQGLYGTIDTTTISNSDIYEIQYLYQVSVVSGTSTTILQNDIIQQLDTIITTAILPRFFDCYTSNTNVTTNQQQRRNNQYYYNNNDHRHHTNQRRRFLQDGIISAISSMPTDTYILSGLSCPKIIDNTDCYVVQGVCTVFASGFTLEQSVESIIQVAVVNVLQNSNMNIISNLNMTTTLVVDISSLTDTLEVTPPTIIRPQQPIATIPSPIISPNTSPISNIIPTTQITFAPIPGTNPTFDFPSFRLPTTPTISDSNQPTMTDTNTTTNNTSTQPISTNTSMVPTTTPTKNTNNDNDDDEKSQSSDNSDPKIDWWAWLLIAMGGIAIGYCCFTVITKDQATSQNNNNISTNSTKSQNKIIKKSTSLKQRNKKSDQQQRNNQDTDDDDNEAPYEPPPAMFSTYTTPPITDDTILHHSHNNIDDVEDDDHNAYQINQPPPSPPIFHQPAQITPPPPPPVFIMNNDNDDDVAYDDDDEIDDEEEQYTDEEEEDMEVGDDVNHDEGEVFEDEESYYEEEEDEDEDGRPTNGIVWGNEQGTFDGLY